MTPLRPRGGPLYVVHWTRDDGRGTRQRYYRMRSHAERFRTRLEGHGFDDVEIYGTTTTWREVSA